MRATTEKTTVKSKILNRRQQALFIKYYPIVNKVVNSMRSKLPTYADLDELHSAGVSGLADAISRLDPAREKTFASYVSTRIRGAIIDELRDLDYMSRSARSDAKNMDHTRDAMEQKLGRTPTEEELRREMGVEKKQFRKILRRTQTCSFISLNESPDNADTPNAPLMADSIADENARTAVENVERREMADSVRRNIASLPDKQRRVLEGYYFQEKKLGEIAREFGLTEARICQIHSQALNSLRPKLVN